MPPSLPGGRYGIFHVVVTPFTTLCPTGPFMMGLAPAAGVVGMD